MSFYRRRYPYAYRPSSRVAVRALPSRDKYSIETTSFAINHGNTTLVSPDRVYNLIAVAPTDIQGVRKVKNCTVNVACINTTDSTQPLALMWALVFVPAGTSAGAVLRSGNFYEPNQFVMAQGTYLTTAGPLRVFSPLARNLNSGDSVVLCMRILNSETLGFTVQGTISYAVTLQ